MNPRRAAITAEADRLHAEYLTLQELRKPKRLTHVQLAETLGTDKLRPRDGRGSQTDGRIPGTAPVALEGLGETEELRRVRAGKALRASLS